AALTSLQEVASRGVPEYLAEFGVRLQNGLNEIADDIGLAVECSGIAWHPHLKFAETDPQIQTQLATLYIQEMAKRGCHGYASFYLNAAQGEAELTQTLNAARETFSILASALRDNQFEDRLECELRSDSFRRLVH
ncbi:MAG: hypothetical protein GY917_02785, partial [Planctomycetaceae bacterium]|nr:hypothetical protein [Planctomycetaceae bacterium]